MDVSPHIVRMSPHLVEKVWGGQKLARYFGKDLLEDRPFGEAWEVADLEEGQSRVASGPLVGQTLGSLSRAWGRALVGKKAAESDRFPLLVKLLDADRDLSVQVHPGREDAAALPGAASKEESWLILQADPGAEIVHGLIDDAVDEEHFRQAALTGQLEPLLRRVAVKAGDVIDVAPGTIHAICQGVALLEIQEPSDTTYRVYDYERPGLDGEPRQLHLEKAVKVARLGRSPRIYATGERLSPEVEMLTKNRAFRCERVKLRGEVSARWKVSSSSVQVLHLVKGRVRLADGLGGVVELGTFETAVVPASLGLVELTCGSSSVEMVVAGLPQHQLVDGLEIDEPAVAKPVLTNAE